MWKKQTAANLFICVVIERSLSSITPSLRTWDDGWIAAPAINRGVMGQSWRRRGDPSQISSVFAGLRRRRFWAIQFLTSSTQEDRRSTSDEVWAVSTWEYIWRSSAYEWALSPCLSTIRVRSAVYRMYKRGPSTEPCGTPHSRCTTLEDSPLKWKYWERSVTYDRTHSKTTPAKPKRWRSLSMRMPWSITSKAELWSSNASRVTRPLSAAVCVSDNMSSSAVSVEWNFL